MERLTYKVETHLEDPELLKFAVEDKVYAPFGQDVVAQLQSHPLHLIVKQLEHLLLVRSQALILLSDCYTCLWFESHQ